MMNKSIRLTGKAWQIRSQLREWAKSPITLAEFIDRNTKKGSHLRLIK
jgi:hypothetical protein